MNARKITDGSEAIVSSSSEADTSPLTAAASKQYVTPKRLKLQNTVTPSTVEGPSDDQAPQGEASSCQEQIEIAPKQPESSKQDVKTTGAKSPASINLGPRLTGGKSPAKAMSLMPRKSPSDASSKENVDAVKKVASTGNAAKRNLGNVMQRGDRSNNSNAVQGKKGIPPPSQFLAAKISPLRSSARIKKQHSPRPEKGEGPAAAAAPSRSPLPDIAKADLLSPCGMFLTPRTPNRLAAAAGATAPLTPSNFASDFGKGSTADGIDASGVFAWLHSPTLGANGLFSPNGGLAQSLTNTPRGMYGFSCKTPHTPSTTANPSNSSSQPFFFDPQQGSADREDKNSMICISPVASKKPSAVTSTPNPNEHVPSTPMSIDFTKVFATPRLPTPRLSKSSGSAMKQGIQTPVLSSMERNIIDEDLNAMLQLAEATPSGTRSIGFLSPLLTNSFRKVGGGQGDHLRPDESLSDLQLPVISGRVASGFSPSLAARSSSSKGSLKGSQKRKAGDMDRPSQRHSYPQPPHASMLHYRHQNGPPSQGGFYPQPPPPGYPMSAFPPSNQYPNAPQHRQYKAQANPPGQPEKTKRKAAKNAKAVIKKAVADDTSSSASFTPSPPCKKPRKSPSKPRRPKSKNALPDDPEERERLASAIRAVNQKNGGKNSEAAELAAAIMRGVTCRPSGKWVSSLCHNSLLHTFFVMLTVSSLLLCS